MNHFTNWQGFPSPSQQSDWPHQNYRPPQTNPISVLPNTLERRQATPRTTRADLPSRTITAKALLVAGSDVGPSFAQQLYASSLEKSNTAASMSPQTVASTVANSVTTVNPLSSRYSGRFSAPPLLSPSPSPSPTSSSISRAEARQVSPSHTVTPPIIGSVQIPSSASMVYSSDVLSTIQPGLSEEHVLQTSPSHRTHQDSSSSIPETCRSSMPLTSRPPLTPSLDSAPRQSPSYSSNTSSAVSYPSPPMRPLPHIPRTCSSSCPMQNTSLPKVHYASASTCGLPSPPLSHPTSPVSMPHSSPSYGPQSIVFPSSVGAVHSAETLDRCRDEMGDLVDGMTNTLTICEKGGAPFCDRPTQVDYQQYADPESDASQDCICETCQKRKQQNNAVHTSQPITDPPPHGTHQRPQQIQTQRDQSNASGSQDLVRQPQVQQQRHQQPLASPNDGPVHSPTPLHHGQSHKATADARFTIGLDEPANSNSLAMPCLDQNPSSQDCTPSQTPTANHGSGPASLHHSSNSSSTSRRDPNHHLPTQSSPMARHNMSVHDLVGAQPSSSGHSTSVSPSAPSMHNTFYQYTNHATHTLINSQVNQTSHWQAPPTTQSGDHGGKATVFMSPQSPGPHQPHSHTQSTGLSATQIGGLVKGGAVIGGLVMGVVNNND